jgi:hypothetical protein
MAMSRCTTGERAISSIVRNNYPLHGCGVNSFVISFIEYSMDEYGAIRCCAFSLAVDLNKKGLGEFLQALGVTSRVNVQPRVSAD